MDRYKHFIHLETCRHPLVHFQVLFSAVQSTSALLVQHLPCGEVPHAVLEADLAQLVVVGHEVPEGLDLLRFCLLRVHDDTDQGLINLWNSGHVMRECSQTHKPSGNEALTSL